MDDQTGSRSPETTPGWGTDPYGRHELRYWDGFGWTEHVSDAGEAGIDAPVAAASPWAAMTAVAEPAGADLTRADPASAEPPTAASIGAKRVAPDAEAVPTHASTPTTVTPPAGPSASSWDAPATPTPTAPVGPSGPAWDPVTTSAPTTTWTPPAVPAAVPPAATWGPPPSFDAPGVPLTRRSRRRVIGVVLAGLVALVVLLGVYGSLNRPERIDAGPPAATPAGYRLVETDDYAIAVPEAWSTETVTDEDREDLADRIDEVAPGTGAEIRDSAASIDGTQLVAIDPVGGENVQVVRTEPLGGDPRDADVIDEISVGLTRSRPGLSTSGLSVVPSDVHGFPAAKATYTLVIGATRVFQVATVVQAGDHVYLLSVSSRSAVRAEELSSRIVPTFDPV